MDTRRSFWYVPGDMPVAEQYVGPSGVHATRPYVPVGLSTGDRPVRDTCGIGVGDRDHSAGTLTLLAARSPPYNNLNPGSGRTYAPRPFECSGVPGS